MKKNIVCTLAFIFCFMSFLVGCAATKDIANAMQKNNIGVRAEESYIADWKGRTLGGPVIPEWLYELDNGNEEPFRANFGINQSYIIKMDDGYGVTEADAKLNTKLEYNGQRAQEVKTSVRYEAEKELGKETKEYENFDKVIMESQVQLSGQELVTEFWQKEVTVNKETGLEEVKYRCWAVYKIPSEDWLNTIKIFMKSILPSLSDSESKKNVAGLIDEIYVDSTSNSPKLETELNEEQNIIYNSEPGANVDDLDWLNILETAANIIL